MKTQISRHTFLSDKRYSGVYQQQGRMLVDADWNELVDIVKHRLDDALKDVVKNGAPMDNGIIDFTTDPAQLKWGSVYAHGIKGLLLPRIEEGSPTPALFDFTRQQDFPGVDTIAPSGDYILYADLWERPVISIEDEMLRDPGLHGADTCTRTRTMVQVKWCADTIDPETQTDLNPQKGDAELDVSLRLTGTGDGEADPCGIEITSIDQKTGNTLFRLETHDVTGDANNPDAIVLKWSAENGAEQHVVREEGVLVDTVPDEFKTGDWIYEPYSDTSETHLGVHLASGSGFPARFDLISDGYPTSISSDAQYIRRWDGYCELTKNGTWSVSGKDGAIDLAEISASTPDENATHGSVKFESGRIKIFLNNMTLTLDLDGKHFVAGDHWLAVVRDNAEEEDQIKMASPAPMGITHHYLKIARFQANTIIAPDSEETRKFSFPALSNLTADKVGYDPSTTQARWTDIHDNPALPMPLTVQGAIDDLVENLESSDITYQFPPCTDDTASAKSTIGELLRNVEGWNESVSVSIKTLLDTLLCKLDAHSIPYLMNSDQTLNDVILDKTSGGTINGNVQITNGDLSIDQDLTVTGTLSTSAFQLTTTPQNNYVLTSDANGDASWQLAPGSAWEVTGANNLVVDSSLVTGNVGIGTNTPSEKLEVTGNAKISNSLSVGGAASATGQNSVALGVQSAASGLRAIAFGDNARATSQESIAIGSNITVSGAGSLGIRLGVGGSTVSVTDSGVMAILNGNVGIGTSPSDTLDVNGDLRIRGGDIKDAGGTSRINIVDNGNLNLRDENGATVVAIGTDRRVGIGTTDRLSKLTVRGHSGWKSGTVAVTNGSISVAGTGTSFLSDVGIGDQIFVNGGGGYRIVTGIASDTNLTVDGQFTISLSGQTWWVRSGLFRADYSTGGPRFFISHAGNVGIGTVIPGSDKLDVRGRCYSSGGWQTTNADYAEYFETSNGKAIPVATPVTLTSDGKVKKAGKNEVPIGITSANSALVGNSYKEWPEKYLQDEYGQLIMEKVKKEITFPKKKKITKERQKTKKDVITEEKVSRKIVREKGKYIQKEIIKKVKQKEEVPMFDEVDLYDSTGKTIIGKHQVPVMESYEEEVDVLDEDGMPVLVGTGEFDVVEQPKLNPKYDASKEYIPRSERPEWCCVGLLGQLPLRKGSPVAPTWIKIKDLSDKVELWLVK